MITKQTLQDIKTIKEEIKEITEELNSYTESLLRDKKPEKVDLPHYRKFREMEKRLRSLL